MAIRRAFGLPAALMLLAALGGCAAAAPVDQTAGPVLLVAFTPNVEVRRGFERRLEADLQTAGIRAIPSIGLIRDFDLIDRRSVLGAAVEREAPLILMVRRIITETDERTLDGTPPPGVQRHRTLREYFLAADRRRLPDVPPPGRQVIEVAGYLLEGDVAELAWSGYTWVNFDGDLDAAITDTADFIAARMIEARDAIRNAR